MFKHVSYKTNLLEFLNRTQPIAFSNAEDLYTDLILLRDEFLKIYGSQNELVDYMNKFIDDFESNLTTTVSGKIDELVDNGVLDELINVRLLNDINRILSESSDRLYLLETNKMDKDTTDISVSQINKNKGLLDASYFSESFLTLLHGATINATVLNDNSVTTPKLANKATTREKLSDNFMENALVTSGNLDEFIKDGSTLCVVDVASVYVNTPPFPYSFRLTVFNTGGWVQQIASSISTDDIYVRRFRSNENGIANKGSWKPLLEVDYTYIDSTKSVNSLVKDGKYVAISPKDAPIIEEEIDYNYTYSWMVEVKTYRSLPENETHWGIQKLTNLNSSTPFTFFRTFYYSGGVYEFRNYARLDNVEGYFTDNGSINEGDLYNLPTGVTLVIRDGTGEVTNIPYSGSGVVITFSATGGWRLQLTWGITGKDIYFSIGRLTEEGTLTISTHWTKLSGGSSSLTGRSIGVLGDSIIGNTQGTNSIPGRIQEKTGATVYNLGFGGSRVSEHAPDWNEFSFYRLAEEIVKDNSDPTKWVAQDQVIVKLKAGQISGMPPYFERHLNTLKGLNFNTLTDLCFSAGTNDYTAKVATDNPVNRLDTKSYSGALRYGLELIMNKYPHLNILLCTPMYRFWIEGGVVVDDSDTREFAGQILPDFVEATFKVGKEFKTPVLDNYFELGINKFNRQLYFSGTDGTHPNTTGNKKLGYKIGSAFISEF